MPARKVRKLPVRSQDNGLKMRHLHAADTWVVCPRCAGPALVRHGHNAGDTDGSGNEFEPHRLTCLSCGYTRGAGERVGLLMTSTQIERDPMLGLPLWLTTRTRHGNVWALNEGHLEVLETFVGATLRERPAGTRMKPHWFIQREKAGRSILSQLPLWIKRAENRAGMITALGRLRAKLAQTRTS